MSAFIVSDCCINEILNWVLASKTCERTRALLEEFDLAACLEIPCGIEILGRCLNDLNRQAIMQRYPEDEDMLGDCWQSYGTPEDESIEQAFKSLSCLSYQCCEGDVPQTYLYAFLDAAKRQTGESIVRKKYGDQYINQLKPEEKEKRMNRAAHEITEAKRWG